MSAQSLYELSNVTFHYQLGNQRVQALQNVNLSIASGEFVCLRGPSGSGKTTLLNLLGLIEPPQDGTALFEGDNLGTISEKQKNHIRRFRIGFVFQNFHLIPVLRADENVEYFLSRQGLPKTQRKARVEAALRSVGLWEHRHKKPLEMSGGQRQRVAIARALAKNPHVIVADEPTASLDSGTGREIMSLLRVMNQEQGVTILVSSHDPMVIDFARRTVELHDGSITAGGN
jgi:putative ABC transport system ATP-binding protein